MTKRRLTRQQAWRIEKIQAERARRAERREAVAGGDERLGPETGGVVIAHYGSQLDVEGDGEAGAPQRCHLRANLDGLVTGDRVVFRAGEPIGVVVARLPRRSLLSRPDARGEPRPVAANIDQVAIVIAAQPAPHRNLIDRYLVATEAMGADALLVVNKVDLLDEPAPAAAMAALLAPYQGLGYRVIKTSRETALKTLGAALAGHTSVLVGQSGVGKTSLVNALLPGLDRRTGELSGPGRKGRHTTTTAELHHLPGGGDLIDSPGIREFGLDHLPREQVAEGFREFRPFLGHCRFRDCRHRDEPGCALLSAVEAGAISRERLASYRHIVDEG
ncbi:small ribosomal subunit biogenesis GTPase RsgA [Pseudohaliea rubra]|uniref:Small ribosomal subunit biogenesis GTPase RsgA n=1 Tax=Pseudohaliea rubra DSM 19751 TaxID=1265313 RepID=A0A095VRM9_9GAMM|nr:small ribosomal subunit biogenesis GTPase RsgA [Pseudohaliea rubra]KGE03748.1 Ribosome small subunit-stimulated GTPase EngC [Pseudohaliea rubra DSM 19751]